MVSHSIWRDTRLIPVYVSGVSVLVFTVSAIIRAVRKAPSEIRKVSESHSGLHAHISLHGGATIYAFKAARTLCVVALLGLSSYNLAHDSHKGLTSKNEVLGLVLSLSYVWASTSRLKLLATHRILQLYASALALLNVASQPSLARLAARHLILVLLASCAVYGHRDIWPLMTYTLRPLDAREGALLWVKIALLAIAGIVIPLTIPRQYVPLDAEVFPLHAP